MAAASASNKKRNFSDKFVCWGGRRQIVISASVNNEKLRESLRGGAGGGGGGYMGYRGTSRGVGYGFWRFSILK